MIVILGVLAGATSGGLIAKKRGGNRADIAQYAFGYGVAFGLLGFLATIALEKLLA